MRVTGFAAMTRQIQAKTGLDLSTAKPLAQVWMYGLLLAVSLLLGLFDAWAIAAPSLT
jgi:C4-dicarboxylate transporter